MNLFTILAWGFLYVPLVLGEGYYSLNFDARVPIALGILGSSYQKYTIMADRSLLGGSNIDLDVTFSGIIELLTNRVHIVVSLPDADGRVSVYDMYSGTSLGYLSFVCSLTTCEVHAVSSSSGATTWTLDGNQLIPTSPSTVYACYRSLVGLLAQYTLNDRTSITAQCEQTNLYVELAIPAFPETTAVWTGTYTTWTTDESGSVIEQMPTPSADTTTTWTGTYTTWTTDADGSDH
ncbi:Hypothetical protein PP7435_CHR3-1225 [Komagataella phaffii CBS 7435]|uniref:Uncharacterized protein n=1 Tax=Komagataella phaffii (strain ATCC 76273 / CBS 7435 / CECT 11047 / NRRL Y-11430 / Wegner 21-1) TaxID=981350 RepID=F2QXN7_KOMPC|nr:Hypothetical protein BQ9382_C3-6443 [Komagataella phaffii CBS 7435]CCA40165.1 Hypothetical protein PP7435_CHR3-1225 [Komagataella phaffii CBS 7435]